MPPIPCFLPSRTLSASSSLGSHPCVGIVPSTLLGFPESIGGERQQDDLSVKSYTKITSEFIASLNAIWWIFSIEVRFNKNLTICINLHHILIRK